LAAVEAAVQMEMVVAVLVDYEPTTRRYLVAYRLQLDNLIIADTSLYRRPQRIQLA